MEDFSTFIQSMIEDWNVKLVGSTIITFFSTMFGTDWWLIQCLFILIFADCACGIIAALRFDGKLSSRRLHDGVVKIIAYCLSIILVWIVQEIAIRTLPIQLPVMALYAGYQSLTEIKSVSHHLERLGIRMPALFHKVTTSVEEKIDDKIDETLSGDDKNKGE